ncbi:pyridoxal-phosphate dependent enzyme [Shigella flexneri]
MKGAMQKAEEIIASNPEKYLLLQRFSNPANPEIHKKPPVPQMWEDTDGQVDVFIAGVGTGGTLTGVSRYIKGTKGKTNLSLSPLSQPILQLSPRRWQVKRLNLARIKIQGIGAGFIRLTSISSSSIKSLASPMKKPFLHRPSSNGRRRYSCRYLFWSSCCRGVETTRR